MVAGIFLLRFRRDVFRKSDYGSRIGRIQILWAVIILYTVAAKTFSTIRPNSRSQIELEITADQPYVTDKPQATAHLLQVRRRHGREGRVGLLCQQPALHDDPNAEYPYLQPAGGSTAITATGMNLMSSSRRLPMNTCFPSWLHQFRPDNIPPEL